ncbi:MAG TPA: pilus assembly protein [Thermogutta sp.]|nr:pilus assembly protein [Thermogutta sp.]
MRFASLSKSPALTNCQDRGMGETSQARARSRRWLRCSPRTPRAGVAVVEFALVAPLFFLLVLGMIEFGRMVMVQQVLVNASREGARAGIVQGATNTDVLAVVQSYLEGGGIHGATVNVSPDPIDLAGYGDPVTVAVSVPFRQVSWLPTPIFLGDTELRATTTMRREAIQ